ncbi:MAG: hypothetical protein FWE34_04890 [Defluviitaleaceae bacterium]|nr:hypothetical protein [Defluviitaleaceae bacterium]
MKKLKGLASLDTLLRMTLPKITTAAINLVMLGGFRVALRSMVQLLRATVFTRILSAITILVLDLYGLARNRISKVQFVRNVVLSILLIVFGTMGWYIGAGWFAIEILGGLIGAGIMGTVIPMGFEKILGRYVKSDEQKMMEIVDEVLTECDCSKDEQEQIKKKITPGKLKLMFASKNREEYAKQLVEDCRGKINKGRNTT